MRNKWVFEVEFNSDDWENMTDLAKNAKLDEVSNRIQDTEAMVMSIHPYY